MEITEISIYLFIHLFIHLFIYRLVGAYAKRRKGVVGSRKWCNLAVILRLAVP